MRKILSGLCASTVAPTFGLARPCTGHRGSRIHAESSVNIQNVQFSPDWRRGGNRAESRNERREDRFERRGNRAYYNGHRGYNQPRCGYRQHNGVWFPAVAFIAGAIVGGALVNQPHASGNAHVQYCYDRYRSYRASDNTFQPYNGPRRQCISS